MADTTHEDDCRCMACCAAKFKRPYTPVQFPAQRPCNHFLFAAWCKPVRTER